MRPAGAAPQIVVNGSSEFGSSVWPVHADMGEGNLRNATTPVVLKAEGVTLNVSAPRLQTDGPHLYYITMVSKYNHTSSHLLHT